MQRLAATLLLLLAGVADGQMRDPAPLVVTTGSEGGTYYRFFNEISQVCAQPPLIVKISKGSRENLDNLLGNQANLGFIQADVLFGRKIIENDPEVDNIKTLLVLYPEEVHLLVRAGNQYIQRFSDLGNKKVGSWGGSTVTAWVTFAKTQVRPIKLQEFPGYQDAIQALDKGAIDAILAVGGQPLDWIRKLPGDYRLVPFDRPEQVRDVYEPAILSYANLNQSGIRTVTTQTLLVTMNYKTPEKVRALTGLRKCIAENLDALRETTGNHPKWRLVNVGAKGTWPWFDGEAAKGKVTTK